MTAGARCPHRVPPFLASIRQYSIGISWKTTHDLETQIEYFRRPGAWRPAEYQPPVDNLDLSNSRSPAVSPTRALLSLAEADLAAARAKLLELNLPSPPVSFDTLRAIHHELFHDVCTWAGQVRTTQIDKRQYDDHTSRVQMFATPDTIEARADALFRSLTEQNFLAGSNRDGFAAGATAVFAELNAIHFARKGNGRTNRLLLSARAANAGHALAFDVITRERMIAVSVAADEDDPSGLRRMHPHHPRWATLRVLIGRAGIDFVLRVRHGDDTPRDGHALPPGCGSSQVVRLRLFARWWHPEPKRVARRQSHTEVCCERESTPAGRTIRDSEDRMVKRAVGDSSTRSGHA